MKKKAVSVLLYTWFFRYTLKKKMIITNSFQNENTAPFFDIRIKKSFIIELKGINKNSKQRGCIFFPKKAIKAIIATTAGCKRFKNNSCIIKSYLSHKFQTFAYSLEINSQLYASAIRFVLAEANRLTSTSSKASAQSITAARFPRSLVQ